VRAISIVSVVVCIGCYINQPDPPPLPGYSRSLDDDEFDDVIMQMHASCLHRGIDPRSIRII
jgi:hypothetical protein